MWSASAQSMLLHSSSKTTLYQEIYMFWIPHHGIFKHCFVVGINSKKPRKICKKSEKIA